MDDALRAAIGYMMPPGSDVADYVIKLQERVDREADKTYGCYIVHWMGEMPLKKGFGHLTAKVQRVGWWEQWTIMRECNGDSWPILRWEGVKNDTDD